MTTVPVTIQDRIPMPAAIGRRPAGPAAVGLNFTDVLRILRQRIFLILFVWFFITGVTAALTWYLEKNYQSFKSDCMVKVDSPNPKTPFEPLQQTVPVETLNRYVIDQVQIIRNRKVLDLALKAENVIKTEWYNDHRNNLIESMESTLSVVPLPNTSFLNVSFTTRNPEDAPKIINTIIEKYLDVIKSESTSAFSSQLLTYNAQLEDADKNLDKLRREKEEFISQGIAVPGVTTNVNVPAEQWRALTEASTRLQVELIQIQGAYESYKKMDPNQVMIDPKMRQSIQNDPQVMALGNALLGLQQNYQTLLLRVGRRNREIASLEANIEAVKTQLAEVTRSKEQEIREFQVQTAEVMFLNALQASTLVNERVSESEEKQRDLDSKMARLHSMELREEMLKHQQEQLWDYVQQLKILVGGQETIRVHKVGDALVPLKRNFPRWEMNIPVGSFMGLLMGIGLALMLELANTTIRTPRDIIRHVHTPILGTVPDLDDEEVAIDPMELACHAAPRSMIAEAFRTVRTNLLLSAPAERQRSVLITSSKPEEGKTSVAVNLAISIGQSGRRVLLIDANFHRPTLHTLFPQARREGLSNILIGRGKLADLISPTDLPNLDVLTSGPIPPNPTELLTSRYLAELISEAAQRYDQVLFDGPPVLLVSDALVLASVVDGVILVCRARSASRGTVQRAREQLERVNAHVFGAVLNAAQVARGGYFREQMRSYYDYQPEEALLGGAPKALPREDNKPGGPA